jgi:hypothetical protein
MNPNAKPFVFRAAAQEWAPSWAPPAAPAQAPVAAAPAPTPVPVPEPEPIVEPTPAADVPPPAPQIVDTQENVEENEDDVDENDPLWIAVLQLAKGDRKEALKMLEDPDALMSDPEIAKIMEESGGDGDGDDGNETKSNAVDDWEKVNPNQVLETEIESRASKSATAEASANDDVDYAPDAEVEIDGDPRDHMNIVFIGHVDAGKSTLSGSILYLMGKVDARTIERFEKEAKQRNRESWFLAFIMVSSPSII